MQSFVKQLKKFWDQLSTGQKLSFLASTLAITLGFATFLFWVNRPHFQLLYGGLNAKDASDIVAELEEQGIPYQLANGGHSILVPQKSVYTVRMGLVEKGIPSGKDVGYEIFDRNYIGISDFMQKTNYTRALQGELSRTIAELNGIRNARVMIVVPENKLLASQANVHPTASVFVDTGGLSLQESAVNAIRSLVANSVEGLKLDDVSVVDNHGKVLSEDLAKSSSMGLSSSHIKMRESLESYFGKKIESMLHSVLGEGQVVARVSVDLENTTTTIVEETYDPESQVVRSQTYQENSSSNNESNAFQGSAEEREANGGQAREISSNENKKNRTIAYDINKYTREIVATPGTIKKITAAVFIAQQASKNNPGQYQPRSDAEINSLKAMIANALGIDNLAHVSVQELAFNTTTLNKFPALDQPLSEQIFRWGPIAKNFISIICCLTLFGILLRFLKKSKAQKTPALTLLDNNTPCLSKSTASTQTLTPEMLNNIIQQKPENVSNALKIWMKNEV